MSERPGARRGGLNRAGLSRAGLSRAGLIGAGLLVVVAWWWWPGLSGQRPEVGVVLGGDARGASEPLDRRLREQGVRSEWSRPPTDWCSVPGLLGDLPDRVELVVVSVDGSGCIDRPPVQLAREMVDTGRRLVVVTGSGIGVLAPDSALAEALSDSGALLVDVGRLLGDVGQPVPCEWWDDCDASGRVVTVDENGLTEAGGQRVARTVVAAVVGEGVG